ncbi:MAG: DUF3667 domain-containing protein [Flavobacteriaceae bacterium]|nr:DUF3667 domain-containing protein [Flavobacteriaceae bacterium]
MSDQKPLTEESGIAKNSRKHFKYRSNTCLNCGHPLDLSDRYCSYCSQLNTTKPLSFKDFFGEFLNSVISYDSRLRYTVRDLLFKPGRITYNYINGKRMHYANPFRFFLSVSIIFFILNELKDTITENSPIQLNENGIEKNDGIVRFSNGKEKDSIDISEAIKMSQNKNSDPAAWNEFKKGFKEGYNETNDSLGALSDSKFYKQKDSLDIDAPNYITQAEIDTIGFSSSVFKRLETYWDFYSDTEIKDPLVALDSLGHQTTKTNIWLYEKNFSFERFKEEPRDFASYMLNKVPFFLFFFTPFFALFFWLIYSKKKYTYMEHTVFIFHIFSFVFLAALIALIPDAILGDDYVLGVLVMLIGPFYFYKALRNFYKQNRLKTIIKFVFLNIVFFFSSTVAALIFFLITAATY